MAERSKSESEKPVTVIVVTSIIALIGTLATVYLSYKASHDAVLIPIMITQTAEARMETRTAGQSVSNSIIGTPTGFAVNTDTPPAPTAVPSLCCLAGWDIFSTENTSFAPSPLGGCSNIGVDELGIHASNCGLIFGKDDIKQRGIYGLSMPIQHNVKIQISVSISNLIEGEFWVGFSNGIDPKSGSLVYAMTPDPGGVSVFFNDISSPYARYKWADMAPDIGWVRGQPWQYNFTIQLDGSNVLVDVNSVKFAPMVSSSTERLFIGYRSKPDTIGTYVDATISKLIITNNP